MAEDNSDYLTLLDDVQRLKLDYTLAALRHRFRSTLSYITSIEGDILRLLKNLEDLGKRNLGPGVAESIANFVEQIRVDLVSMMARKMEVLANIRRDPNPITFNDAVTASEEMVPIISNRRLQCEEKLRSFN